MIRTTLILMGLAASTQANEIRIPLADTARPAVIHAQALNGGITVSGYEGREVIAESRGKISADTEPGNNIRIHGPSIGALSIRVPFMTSLHLESTSGGAIRIDRVTGDLELSNTNGSIHADGVAGSIVADTVNGGMHITFDRISGTRPSSLSTLNGGIDVTMPADAKATLQMKTDNGRISSEFELKLPPGTYGRGQTTTAALNGGGPSVTIKTFNGSIRLHKK